MASVVEIPGTGQWVVPSQVVRVWEGDGGLTFVEVSSGAILSVPGFTLNQVVTQLNVALNDNGSS